MKLCLPSPLAPAAVCWVPALSAVPLPLCPPHLAQSPCSVTPPEQLSYTYKSSLQFHSFQSSLLPAPALNLTLHKSISKGAGEQRTAAPWLGRAGQLGPRGVGLLGGLCPLPQGAPCASQEVLAEAQREKAGAEHRVTAVPRATLALICGD